MKASGKKGFERLFKSCYKPFFAIGFRMTGNKELTKDTIQAFFLDLYEKQHQISNIENLSAYLATAFRRRIAKEAQKLARLNDQKSKSFTNENTPSYEDLLIKMNEEEDQENKLLRQISSLPAVQKEMLKMRFFEELSYKDIAEVTGKSPQTIYNQIHSAINKLKKGLLSFGF